MPLPSFFVFQLCDSYPYLTKEGEEKQTNFAELVTICDQFFPPLAHLSRKDAIEDETKEAM